MDHHSHHSDDRQIRVFVSSTFGHSGSDRADAAITKDREEKTTDLWAEKPLFCHKIIAVIFMPLLWGGVFSAARSWQMPLDSP